MLARKYMYCGRFTLLSMRLFVSVLFSVPLFAVTYPKLPVATVDVTCCAPVTRTVAAHNAKQLQAAFDDAQLGDNIVLDAGAAYEGNFMLSVPRGTSGWVTVSTTAIAKLPAPGIRVSPKDAVNMAKIKSPDVGHPGDPNSSALSNKFTATTLADAGVHHFRFIGIEFATGLTNTNYHVIWLSPLNVSAPAIPASMPHDIIIDRCLMHGNDPLTTTFPNGPAYLNGSVQFDVANGAIVDSYIYNLWGIGVETQALTCGGGPGPRLLQNNTISGGTEAFMCGGSILPYHDRITTDITVVHNYFTHPAEWKTSKIVPYVKNLFELKVGNRVRLTDNVIENSWDRGAGQVGAAIVLTPRSWQDSGEGADRAVLAVNEVSDVLVANNVVRNVGRFLGAQLYDNYCDVNAVKCLQSARYLIANNLADYDTAYFPSVGAISVSYMQDFSVKRNTLLGHNAGGGAPSAAIYGNRTACSDKFGTNFEWSYNINLNGLRGDCQSDPADILVSSWLGSVSVTSNLVANVTGDNLAAWRKFGHGSKIAVSEAAIALTADELTLERSSPYYGLGIGANLSCFNEAAIRAGTPSPLCPLPPEVLPRPAGSLVSSAETPQTQPAGSEAMAPRSSMSPAPRENDKGNAPASPVAADKPSSPASSAAPSIQVTPPNSSKETAKNPAPPKKGSAAKTAANTPATAPPSATGDSARYVLGANDLVQVQVWGDKNFTGMYAIGPDGMMSLPLITDFKAVGLTTVGLKDLITEKLQDFIKEPEVTVQLLRNNSKKYTLIGGVLKTGPYPLMQETTILDALAAAGGFRDFANLKKIYLLRGTKQYHFNYKEVIAGKHMEQNILIEDGDIINVPD